MATFGARNKPRGKPLLLSQAKKGVSSNRYPRIPLSKLMKHSAVPQEASDISSASKGQESVPLFLPCARDENELAHVRPCNHVLWILERYRG